MSELEIAIRSIVREVIQEEVSAPHVPQPLLSADEVGVLLGGLDKQSVAGLPEGFRVYDLRHTFATIGLQAEVDYRTLSDEMGHANVAFTLDTYTHVLKEMREAAADKRERILRGTK